MNTLPSTGGTFQTEAKTCSERGKALMEIERRVNRSSVTYSAIMAGFLKCNH